jgi:hypothetical protein
MPTAELKGVKRVCDQCHQERNMDKYRSVCYSCRRLNQLVNAGTVRTPDFKEVNVENYKEPMEKVKDGYGYYGAITTTNDGKQIQCHICGYYYANVGSHIKAAHKVNPRDYKIKYGLRINDGLLSPIEREHRQEVYNTYARKSPEEFREMSRKAQAVIKEKGIQLGGKAWGPQTRNEKGMCKEQTIAKIKVIADMYNGIPSYNAFIREYGPGQRDTINHWFGSWNKAVEAAGFKTHDVRLKEHKKEMQDMILLKLQMFYDQHGRTPQWADFQAGSLGFNIKTLQYHFGSLNRARQEAGIPIMVYDSKAWKWVELESDKDIKPGDLIPSRGGRLAPAEGGV